MVNNPHYSFFLQFNVDKINMIPEPKKPFNKGRLYSSSLISGARKGT